MSVSKKLEHSFLVRKNYGTGWVGGRMDGWMGGWRVKLGLGLLTAIKKHETKCKQANMAVVKICN